MRGFLRSLADEGRAVLVSSHLMGELAGHRRPPGGRRPRQGHRRHQRGRPDRGRVRRPGDAAHHRPDRGDDGADPRGGHRGGHRPGLADGLRADRASGSWRCSAAPRCRSPRSPRTAPRSRRRTWNSPATRSSSAPAGGQRGGSAMTAGTDHAVPVRPEGPGATASRSCCGPSGPSSAPCAAGSSPWSPAALLTALAVALIASARQRRSTNTAACPVVADRPGRRGGHRQLLLRAPAAGRQRQHHRAGDLADRRPNWRRQATGRHRARTSIAAVGQGRDHHQGEHHGRARRTPRSWSPPATACGCSTTSPTTSPACPAPPSAASPRWLRLTRSGDTITGYDSTGRHALDRDRHRHPGRAPVDGAGRALRGLAAIRAGRPGLRQQRPGPPLTLTSRPPSTTSAWWAGGRARPGPPAT